MRKRQHSALPKKLPKSNNKRYRIQSVSPISKNSDRQCNTIRSQFSPQNNVHKIQSKSKPYETTRISNNQVSSFNEKLNSSQEFFQFSHKSRLNQIDRIHIEKENRQKRLFELMKQLQNSDQRYNYINDNGKYEGGKMKGMKQGFGIIYFTNKQKFMGNFKNNKAQGHESNGNMEEWKFNEKDDIVLGKFNKKMIKQYLMIQQQKRININDRQDFVKALHYQKQQIICIFEKYHIQVYDKELQNLLTQLWFQSPLYDCRKISQQVLMVSNCKMPIRFYKNNSCIGAISDKKQNSQIFLSPLQITITQNKCIIGGGCKFVSIYDTQSMKANRIAKMNKINVSSISSIGQTIISGSFQGNIYIIDKRNDNIINYKPHVDGITTIISVQQNNNYFISEARKDNYKYLWDIRNLSTFVTTYIDQVYGNQRIGMANKQKYLFTGSQNGLIKQYNVQNGVLIHDYQVTKNKQTVTGVDIIDNKILYSTGSRKYDQKIFSHQIASILVSQFS